MKREQMLLVPVSLPPTFDGFSQVYPPPPPHMHFEILDNGFALISLTTNLDEKKAEFRGKAEHSHACIDFSTLMSMCNRQASRPFLEQIIQQETF